MATAGRINLVNQTNSGAAAELFNSEIDGGTCQFFYVENFSGATVIRVNVEGLHSAGDGAPVGPSSNRSFRLDKGIRRVIAWSESALSTPIGWGVQGKKQQ